MTNRNRAERSKEEEDVDQEYPSTDEEEGGHGDDFHDESMFRKARLLNTKTQQVSSKVRRTTREWKWTKNESVYYLVTLRHPADV